jgi:hypothetical protein
LELAGARRKHPGGRRVSEFLSIRNFKKFHHGDALRDDGRPTRFIRLNVGTRREPEFQGRWGKERYRQWCELLEWAGETNNKLPNVGLATRVRKELEARLRVLDLDRPARSVAAE